MGYLQRMGRCALVTMRVGGDSMMFQVPRTEIVQHQQISQCPWLSIDTEGQEELEITDLKITFRIGD